MDSERGFNRRRLAAMLPMLLGSMPLPAGTKGRKLTLDDYSVPTRRERFERRKKLQRTGSKYQAHQGKKECERRLRQMERMAAKAA